VTGRAFTIKKFCSTASEISLLRDLAQPEENKASYIKTKCVCREKERVKLN